MKQPIITMETINQFRQYLRSEERETGTVEKYCRDIGAFATWINGSTVNREMVIAWKEHLRQEGYAPATINSMLVALNRFFQFLGWDDFRVKALRIQRRMFRNRERELSREEYGRLVEAARKEGKDRLALLMETICATGIRVGEVKFITVEAVRVGHAEVSLKGKIRIILIPRKLCQKLEKYSKKQKITSGEIFLTRNGSSLSRRQIWAEMKAICTKAKVQASKVFPHNLRHLFARCFYQTCQDVVKLADVLGHTSVETTRIYLISSGYEHAYCMDHLGLVLSI